MGNHLVEAGVTNEINRNRLDPLGSQMVHGNMVNQCKAKPSG